MHLPPCFCNNTVLTYLQIYLHGSLPQGGKAGGRTYLALLNMVEKENEHRCELLLCSPTKLSCFKLLLLYTPSLRPITLGCCRAGLLSPPPTGKWDNLLLTLSIPQPSNHKGAEMMQIPSSRPGKRPFYLCPAALPAAFCILHPNMTCFTAPLQRIVLIASIVSETE